jgi:hypothetical protein
MGGGGRVGDRRRGDWSAGSILRSIATTTEFADADRHARDSKDCFPCKA